MITTYSERERGSGREGKRKEERRGADANIGSKSGGNKQGLGVRQEDGSGPGICRYA